MSLPLPTEDVVVYRVIWGPDGDYQVVSWGRDTRKVAEGFCAVPKWPASPEDSFVAADDWGHGEIVAATKDLLAHVGKQFRDFCSAGAPIRAHLSERELRLRAEARTS